MRAIDLPPYAPILIESTRAIGYSLEAAIADIIDNCIAAEANRIDVCFYPIGEAYIAILDNGTGMSEDEINRAMQYGSVSPLVKRSTNDLGRFGLGLKTASLSQCRSLTVISKQNENVLARRWDVDYVTQTGRWSLIVLEQDEIRELPCIEKLLRMVQGTLVLWQNLDRLKLGETNFQQAMSQKMTDVRQHLAYVYHRYLNGEPGLKRIAIALNEEPVIPADPFLQKKSYQAMDDEILTVHGEKVVIRPYILPHLSKLTNAEITALGGKEGLRRQQGFYIYRNKRLLAWGTWFRMMRQGDLSKLARIQVDLPNSLDDLWTLDIKKSMAIPPAELRQSLSAVIQRMAEKSKQTWVYRGKKEVSDSIIHIWNRIKAPNGDILYEINRDHPLVTQLQGQRCNTASLEMLLRRVEQGLPINQLYVDLNNDEHLKDETDVDEAAVREMLEGILATCGNDSERSAMVNSLQYTEPFNSYPELLNSYT